MKQIETFDIRRMRNEEHFGFMKLVEQQLPNLPENKAIKFAGAFTTALDNEELILEKQQRRSLYTPSLTTLDKARDNALRGIHFCVKNDLQHFKPEVVLSAQKLDAVLDKFGDLRELPYIQENGAIENLCQELEILKSDVQAIGAAEWVAELSDKHKEFTAAFNARNDEQASALPLNATTTARKAMDQAYRILVQVVNALVLLEDEEAYVPFIDGMNALITYQRNVLTRRKASAETTLQGTA